MSSCEWVFVFVCLSSCLSVPVCVCVYLSVSLCLLCLCVFLRQREEGSVKGLTFVFLWQLSLGCVYALAGFRTATIFSVGTDNSNL